MNKIISFLAKYDVYAHITIEAIITIAFGLIFWWLGIVVAIVVGLVKELVFDAYLDWKDIACDAIGIAVGIITILLATFMS